MAQEDPIPAAEDHAIVDSLIKNILILVLFCQCKLIILHDLIKFYIQRNSGICYDRIRRIYIYNAIAK